MVKIIKKSRRYLVYLVVKLFISIISFLPFKAKSSIGAFGGWICFLILKNERKKAEENIRFVLGNKFPEKQLKDIAEFSFINLGRNLIEALHIPKINSSDLKNYVSFEGLDHLDEALKKGKGVIVITAHIGSWEFFPASVSMIGYPTAIIARRYSNPWIDEMLKNLRAFHRTKVIVRKKGSESQMIKKAFKVLHNNEMLGLLIDQYTKRGFVCVDFFGKPATAPTGPAVFAMRTGAAVLPGCAVRKDKYNFLVKFYPPEEVITTGDKEKDILTNTANFTKAIERMIIEYPYQWAWMHDRWKLKKNQKLKIKNQNFRDRKQNSEDRSQKSEFRIQNPEDGNLKSEISNSNSKPETLNLKLSRVAAEPCSASNSQQSAFSLQQSDVATEPSSVLSLKDESRTTSHDQQTAQQSGSNLKPETLNLKLPYVEIYSKPDCSLCDKAKKVLMNVKKRFPFSLKETDISSDKKLFEEYKEQIPVIFINGKKAFKFRVDEKELKKKLTT